MANQIKTILLLGLLSSLLVGMGAWMGTGMMYLAIGMALVMNVGAYYFSDRMVLAMHGAKELSPEEAPALHAMVGELAMRAGIPKPRVFRIADPSPNAFATGRNPAHGVVAVTDGIMEILSPRELRGVIAHELAHIKNRDILVATVASVVAAAISSVASMLQWGMLLGSNNDEEEGGGWGGLLMAFLAPIIAMLLQFAVSRSREYLADQTGAQISGDPEALASALARLERGAAYEPMAQPSPATASLFIVNPFAGAEGVTRLFSTHPATAERIRRLLALRAGGMMG